MLNSDLHDDKTVHQQPSPESNQPEPSQAGWPSQSESQPYHSPDTYREWQAQPDPYQNWQAQPITQPQPAIPPASQQWQADPSAASQMPGPGDAGTPPQRLTAEAQLPAVPPKRSGVRTGAILALTLVIALVFGTGLFAGWQYGRTSTATPTITNNSSSTTSTSIPQLTSDNADAVREAVIANVRPAVVQINVQTRQGNGLGSGVIIDKNGYIVTNNHVVEGATSIEVVLYDNTKLKGTVVGTDPADDLAVVKVNPTTNLVVASLGDSSQLKVGQSVLAIGNPLGIKQTVTSGIISALGRSVSESSSVTIPNTIQTDAPINPGNSGGALVDMQGKVIGIPTLTAVDPSSGTAASGVGFAIPSNRVSYVTQQIIKYGKVVNSGRAALGVSVTDVDSTVASRNNLSVKEGALIVEVTGGGAASQAGLQAGDVIVQIDNATIEDTGSLGDVLGNKNPGDKVAIKIYRGSQQLTLNVTLGELQTGN
jgi:S1-C subfamily serine protease